MLSSFYKCTCNVLEIYGKPYAVKKMLTDVQDTMYGYGTIDFAQIMYKHSDIHGEYDLEFAPNYSSDYKFIKGNKLGFFGRGHFGTYIKHMSYLYPDVTIIHRYATEETDYGDGYGGESIYKFGERVQHYTPEPYEFENYINSVWEEFDSVVCEINKNNVA